MKKKILLGFGAGVIAILLLVFIVVGFFLGDVVKAGMETIGPKVTQTQLKVGSVQISTFTGAATVENLELGNPAEFVAKSPYAITVNKTSVSVKPASLLTGKIVIKNIEVKNPEITFLGNPLGANNLKKIMDNVNAFAGGAEANPAEKKPAPTEEKPAGKKLQVDQILITDAKVHFNGATVPLPTIHLENLGTGPDGITPDALIKEMLTQIDVATIKAVIESATKMGKDTAGAAKDATQNLGEEAKKIGKSLGDLFKK